MNTRRQIFAVAISATAFLAIAALLGGITNPQAWGQQDATNPTGTTTNQTGDATMANMTAEDFQPLQDNLNEVREAVQNNNTAAALDALNEADSQLFELSAHQSTSTEDADEASEDEGE